MAKIVLVDDMKVMRLYMRKALERAGFTVDEWEPPAATEIADRLDASKPDLVVTDYMMPGCNGATIARLTRRTHPMLPVLVVTSLRDEEVNRTLMKQGATDVIYKPVSPEDLVGKVKHLLHQS